MYGKEKRMELVRDRWKREETSRVEPSWDRVAVLIAGIVSEGLFRLRREP